MKDGRQTPYRKTKLLEKIQYSTTYDGMISMESEEFKTKKKSQNQFIKILCGYLHGVNILLITCAQ
jgi:hypothetical protein